MHGTPKMALVFGTVFDCTRWFNVVEIMWARLRAQHTHWLYMIGIGL